MIHGAPLQRCWAGNTVDHAKDGRGADGQFCSRLFDRDFPTLGALAFSVRCNLLVISEGGDTRARPAIPAASQFA